MVGKSDSEAIFESTDSGTTGNPAAVAPQIQNISNSNFVRSP